MPQGICTAPIVICGIEKHNERVMFIYDPLVKEQPGRLCFISGSKGKVILYRDPEEKNADTEILLPA